MQSTYSQNSVSGNAAQASHGVLCQVLFKSGSIVWRDFDQEAAVAFRKEGYGVGCDVWRSRQDLYRRRFQTYTVPMMKPLAVALDIWKRYGKDFSGRS